MIPVFVSFSTQTGLRLHTLFLTFVYRCFHLSSPGGPIITGGNVQVGVTSFGDHGEMKFCYCLLLMLILVPPLLVPA
jgi:hypothetical protein